MADKTKVIGVCGVGCVGKSTYCQELLKIYKSENKPRPILLSLGTFFRNTIGPNFFVELDNPAAPQVTENWVRSMVHFSITTAYTYKRDVIFDGFPRTVLQLEWLMNSSHASKFDLPVTLRFLQTSEEEHEARINLRLANCCSISDLEDEKSLVEIRMLKDAALYGSLLKGSQKMAAETELLSITTIDY